MKKTNKIYTLRDARDEKVMADLALQLKEAKAEAKMWKKWGIEVERKPHETNLPAHIGTLNRWDRQGNPTYYMVRNGEVLMANSVQALLNLRFDDETV